MSVAERLSGLQQWHANLRRRLLQGRSVDVRWGRWLPENRFNVDQVPFCLSETQSSTYEEKGAKRVWVVGARTSDDKREGSLQVCIRLKNGVPQPRMTIIFRGQGKRLSKVERESWDRRVNVQFQKKAWADDEFCRRWAETEFANFHAEHIETEAESVLFCDNLSGQTHPSFISALAECNTKLHLFKARCTDELQVITHTVPLLFCVILSYALFCHVIAHRQWHRPPSQAGNGRDTDELVGER